MLLRLVIVLECGSSPYGKRVHNLRGRDISAKESTTSRYRSLELAIARNLDTTVTTRHSNSVPASGYRIYRRVRIGCSQ